ncbi:hypothetical protein D9M72_574460 [compost metagenome]
MEEKLGFSARAAGAAGLFVAGEIRGACLGGDREEGAVAGAHAHGAKRAGIDAAFRRVGAHCAVAQHRAVGLVRRQIAQDVAMSFRLVRVDAGKFLAVAIAAVDLERGQDAPARVAAIA